MGKRGRPVQDTEKYENNKRILEAQDLYYETKDTSVLWKVYPDLHHAVKSLLLKRFGYNVPEYFYHGYFQDIVDDISIKYLEYFVYREKKGLPKIKSPISYAHYMILANYPKDDGVMNTSVNYDVYREETEAGIGDYIDCHTPHRYDVVITYFPHTLAHLLNAAKTGDQLIIILTTEQSQNPKIIKALHTYFPLAILYEDRDQVQTQIKQSLPPTVDAVFAIEHVGDKKSDVFDTIWLGVL